MKPIILFSLSIIIIISISTVPLSYADLTEDVTGINPSDEIDKGFDSLDAWFSNMIKQAQLTGDETPLGTTEDELDNLLEESIKTGKNGKNFLFSFHHLIESAIIAVSPIDIDPLIILIISWIVGTIVMFVIFKGSLKHVMLFAVLFGTVILLFMIGGINPQF